MVSIPLSVLVACYLSQTFDLEQLITRHIASRSPDTVCEEFTAARKKTYGPPDRAQFSTKTGYAFDAPVVDSTTVDGCSAVQVSSHWTNKMSSLFPTEYSSMLLFVMEQDILTKKTLLVSLLFTSDCTVYTGVTS